MVGQGEATRSLLGLVLSSRFYPQRVSAKYVPSVLRRYSTPDSLLIVELFEPLCTSV
jgi:hypothetical protein